MILGASNATLDVVADLVRDNSHLQFHQGGFRCAKSLGHVPAIEVRKAARLGLMEITTTKATVTAKGRAVVAIRENVRS